MKNTDWQNSNSRHLNISEDSRKIISRTALCIYKKGNRRLKILLLYSKLWFKFFRFMLRIYEQQTIFVCRKKKYKQHRYLAEYKHLGQCFTVWQFIYTMLYSNKITCKNLIVDYGRTSVRLLPKKCLMQMKFTVCIIN